MLTIDPRTQAVGAGPGGRGLALIIGVMAVGLAASGWIASLELANEADEANDDDRCIEDERGTCVPSLSYGSVIDVDYLGRFDDAEANSPADDDALAPPDEDAFGEPASAGVPEARSEAPSEARMDQAPPEPALAAAIADSVLPAYLQAPLDSDEERRPPASIRAVAPLARNPARLAGAAACIFQDAEAARTAWQRLPEPDRPLLERFCKTTGVPLP